MYICIHVYMYIMHICIYVYMYICILCIYVYMYICIYCGGRAWKNYRHYHGSRVGARGGSGVGAETGPGPRQTCGHPGPKWAQSGCKRRCGTWVGMEPGWVSGGCKTRVQGWARWDKTWVSDWAKYSHERPSTGRNWNPQDSRPQDIANEADSCGMSHA